MSQESSKGTPTSSKGAVPQRLLGDLRRRVLGWMLLVSLVPVVIMAVQGYHCAMEALMDRTSAHLSSVAEERGAQLEAWMDDRYATVDRLAGAWAFREAVRTRLAAQSPGAEAGVLRFLDEAQAGDSLYEHLLVYNERDELLWASKSGTPALSTDVPNRQGWHRLVGRDELFLRVTQPIRSAADTGHGLGTVVGFLNLSKGLEALLGDHVGGGETIAFRAYAPEHSLFLGPGPSVSESEIATTDASRTTIRASIEINDPRFQVGRIQVIAETEKRTAMVWLGRLRFRATVTGLFTLVVLVFFSLWISDRLGRPLAELARVANLIRRGHVEERLEPMRGAEAEEVRRAVNQMLDESLKQQQAVVRNATLASVGELSSSIVHEMRNPLSSIKMNLQGLERGVRGNARHEELAMIASEQVRRVEGMLDDLLQYGKPVELDFKPTSFKELADASLAVVYDAALSKDVKIELADELQGTEVRVDREQICRALTNLLLNAVQASPEAGTVTLRARKDSDSGHRIHLAVLDSGAGLAKGSEERLFKPFYTTKPDGTGLGLANVKKIMDLHGGAALAENRPEGGAVFTLELPAGGGP